MNRILRIGVDIGGTNVRVGFISGAHKIVEFHAQPLERISAARRPTIHRIVRHACAYILDKTASLEKTGWTVIRQVGVSVPGAYFKDGRVYPDTAPNVPGLERVRPYRLFARGLGRGWRVTPAHVNNDGVLQGWLIAQHYLETHPMRTGKIMCLVPGTGFGAGFVTVKKGKARVDPGPQQFFDVIVRRAKKGEPRVVWNSGNKVVLPARGGEPMIIEYLATGEALGYLGSHFFRRPVTGKDLDGWAMSPKADARRETARTIFRAAGEDIARFAVLVHRGTFRKLLVRYRPKTGGTVLFLLGGQWLVRGAGLKISLPWARKILRREGYGFLKLLPARRIPGLEKVAHGIGVMAASKLVDR